MALSVLLTAETLTPEAGSVGIVLPGLARALEGLGCRVQLVPASSGEAERAAAASEVAHLFGWNAATKAVAVRARAAGRPFVVSPLGQASANPYRRRGLWERFVRLFGGDRLLRSSAAVCALSEVELEELGAEGLAGATRLLPLGIDAPPAGKAVTAGARTILALGPIHPVEGLVPLLKGFAELGALAEGWDVVFAGPSVGDWRMQIEAGVRRKGGDGRVRFEPADDADARARLLATAGVVVAPALHVRPNVSVLEASAVGVPVIASASLAPGDLGRSIRVCAPRRAELASALREALGDSDEQRGHRGAAAGEVVRRRYDWQVLAPEYAELYRRVSAGSGSTSETG